MGLLIFFSHVTHLKRLEVSFYTTDAICGLKVPTNPKKLRPFLEFCHVLKRIASSFARFAAPLYQRLKKDQLAPLGPLYKAKFNPINASKEALISPPVKALLNHSGHVILDIDAGNVQIIPFLLQQQTEKTGKPVKYWLRFLTDAEHKYVTTP